MTRVFKYAKQLKIITDDPTLSVIIPKTSRQFDKLENSRNYYTRDELRKILDMLRNMKNIKSMYFSDYCRFLVCEKVRL